MYNLRVDLDSLSVIDTLRPIPPSLDRISVLRVWEDFCLRTDEPLVHHLLRKRKEEPRENRLPLLGPRSDDRLRGDYLLRGVSDATVRVDLKWVLVLHPLEWTLF